MYNKLSAGAALVVVAAFVASGTASAGQANAASSSLRATPAAMARHITSLGYPYSHAVCHGRGKPKNDTYAAFRCVAKGTVNRSKPTRGAPPRPMRSWTVWAKPLRRGWCGSAFSLKTCHRLTAPVYGSENKCDWDGNYCSSSSDTSAALTAACRRSEAGCTHGDAGDEILCTTSGTNTYICIGSRRSGAGGTWTVAWTKASYEWLPTVTQTS